MRIEKSAIEFEWDKGNIGKNKKHGVEDKEGEEVFLDENKIIYKDVVHSQKEKRFIVIGKNEQGRLLFISFTYRRKRMRIISVRDTDRKEKNLYEEAIKTA